jgi:hypothetical protein
MDYNNKKLVKIELFPKPGWCGNEVPNGKRDKRNIYHDGTPGITKGGYERPDSAPSW